MKNKKKNLIRFARLNRMISSSTLPLLFILPSICFCQPKLDYQTDKPFDDLIGLHRLFNFKSGLLCSAQRKDTVFAVFYFQGINNLACVPLGCLNNSSSEYYYTRFGQQPFEYLRNPSLPLVSKFTTKYSFDQDTVYIFRQALEAHITVTDSMSYYLSHQRIRFIYYSMKKGIYDIKYSDDFKKDAPYFQWPYIEGDFIF